MMKQASVSSTVQGGGKRRAVSPNAVPGCACNPLPLIPAQRGDFYDSGICRNRTPRPCDGRAREQARAMAARGRMDQEVGSPFQDRMRKAGLGGSFAVENVGAGYHTLADAFSGWRDSPPHRANMLNRSVTRMGIAAAYAPASKYKVFWALIFAGSDGRRG